MDLVLGVVMRALALLALGFAFAGCSDPATGAADVGGEDGGQTDVDAAESSADVPDGPDAGEPDGTQPDAAEQDAAEPDAAEPDAQERDAPEPDAPGPQPELEIGADLIASQCAKECERLADKACDLAPVGGSTATCAAQCATAAGEDPWALASYVCFADSCNAQCLSGTPGPEPVCEENCAKLIGCGWSEVLELQPGEVDLCRVTCAGSMVGNPAAQATAACLGAAGDLDCSLTLAQACLEGSDDLMSCQAFCDNQACGAGCVDACKAVPAASRLSWMRCAAVAGCQGVGACEGIPTALPACVHTCEDIQGRCDETELGLLDAPVTESVCPIECTAQLWAAGGTPVEDASSCLGLFEGCPITPDGGDFRVYAATIGCALAPLEPCGTMCTKADECDTIEGGGGPEKDAECPAYCQLSWIIDPVWWADAQVCADEAETCDALGLCFAEGPEP